MVVNGDGFNSVGDGVGFGDDGNDGESWYGATMVFVQVVTRRASCLFKQSHHLSQARLSPFVWTLLFKARLRGGPISKDF